ncbi:MAG: response regulator [Endomicrobia bacterium]|nr:response regulator [Endomicrobiia bacterium]
MIKKILVIDDEPSIANLIKYNLEYEGYEVEIALNGNEALKKVKEFKPELITLDVLMPEMNGFQVLELLKQDEETKNIPVIFISIVEGVQKERGFHLGAVDFLSKPIEFGELLKTIKSIEKGINISTVEAKKSILIIDDEKDIVNYIKEYLETEGYNVFTAYTGPDGVVLAKEKIPDLILLDLHMPGMDGFAVMKILKQDKITEHIPIVILTQYDIKGYRQKALMFGATEYFTKVISEKDLIEHIKKLIG